MLQDTEITEILKNWAVKKCYSLLLECEHPSHRIFTEDYSYLSFSFQESYNALSGCEKVDLCVLLGMGYQKRIDKPLDIQELVRRVRSLHYNI